MINRLRTVQMYNFNVTPDDVLPVTKIYGCLSNLFGVLAGLSFSITTLNRFQPFADGFGFHRHVTTGLMVSLVALAMVSIVGGSLAVQEIGYRYVTILTSLFWGVAVIFDLVVMIAMVWATVAKKRVIFVGEQIEQRSGRETRLSNPKGVLDIMRLFVPTLRRSNRTLVGLLLLIILLDLLALVCYISQAFYREAVVAISTFSSYALFAFYLFVAIEFVSQFRNVLKLEGKLKRKEAAIGTNIEDGTLQLSTQFKSFDVSYSGDDEHDDAAGPSGIQLRSMSRPRAASADSGACVSDGSASDAHTSDPSNRNISTIQFERAEEEQVSPLRSSIARAIPDSEGDDGRSHVHPINFAVSVPFQSTRADELDLRIGDGIRCTRTFADGWGYGENVNTRQKGMFPLNSVSVVEKQGLHGDVDAVSTQQVIGIGEQRAIQPTHTSSQPILDPPDPLDTSVKDASPPPADYAAPMLPIYSMPLTTESDQLSQPSKAVRDQ
ncbi:hypothetical protein BJ742DRAFT_531546 [Cladochytrium replicatum]|nr:hypothetical protein BJ742DRAFT_531546 [Cladochytrium replicatum]